MYIIIVNLHRRTAGKMFPTAFKHGPLMHLQKGGCTINAVLLMYHHLQVQVGLLAHVLLLEVKDSYHFILGKFNYFFPL